jgi:hypothetical protein
MKGKSTGFPILSLSCVGWPRVLLRGFVTADAIRHARRTTLLRLATGPCAAHPPAGPRSLPAALGEAQLRCLVMLRVWRGWETRSPCPGPKAQPPPMLKVRS